MASHRRLHISVRADAGPTVGYGHVRRTLAVMDRLRRFADIEVTYLMTRGSDADAVARSGWKSVHLRDRGFESMMEFLRPVNGPLVLDTYTLTRVDLERLHQDGQCCLVFDDGQRLDRYAAEVVVDYSPGSPALAYRGHGRTRFCLGPRYFPLRPEFARYRTRLREQQDPLHAVVTFGGSDPDDLTSRVLRLLARQEQGWMTTAVLGPGYRGDAETLAEESASLETRRNVKDMAPLLASADFAIAGAGGTALELAYLGVPALLLSLSDDQRPIAASLEEAGAAINLGWYGGVRDEDIWSAADQLSRDLLRRQAIGAAGQRLVDGRGADRIARGLLEAWKAAQSPRPHLHRI